MNQLPVELQKILDFLKTELSRLQTGRASASLVEHIEADVYGSRQPLKNIANISIPDAKQIAIQPWDKSTLQSIEKAIQESNLGFNPNNDGTFIRINLPPMTEERRKDLIKLVGKLAEEAKISVRNVRQDHMKAIKAQEKEIGEDAVKHEEKQIQEQVDKANQDIESLAKKKEEEVKTV